MPLRRLLALLLVALVCCPAAAVAAPAEGGAHVDTPVAAPASAQPAVHAPTPGAAWTARIVAPVAARAQPRATARVVRRLTTQAAWWGGPEVLLVLGARDVDGERWLDVLVKGMPAGSHGWIPATAARLARTDRRIVIDLSERSLRFQRGGRTALSTPVVIGAASTPTPVGQFAVDAVAPEPRGSLLGPRVLALVAYSRALARYQGGIPQAAIHASDLLGDPLGSAASHGCVRAPQALVNRLLTLAPRGTPVLIRR